MINPERYRQIDEVFQAALEVAPAERPAFVTSACSGDESLRQEVAALLASAEQEWRLIDEPVPEIAAIFLPDRHPELSIGERLGHYEILSLLGTGGMGQVYLAQDARLGRKVAIKLLQCEFTWDEFRLRRFQQEARAASSLNHPNILTIHEVGLADTRHFIATEFIDGETLRRRMNRSRLSLHEALRIAAQAAEALAAAHSAGIVHRDIKPENIMLRPDGYVKVLDFGLAKLTEQQGPPEVSTEVSTIDKEDTHSGMIMGTVRYMSPEQARGQEVDVRCDIFSLGVVVYEMIAGCPPFEGETNSDVIAALLKVEPPPLAQYSADAPAELQNIVSRALCKDRDQRYQRIEDMSADVERLNEQLGLNAKLQHSAHSTSTPVAATDVSQNGIQAANELSTSTRQTKASPWASNVARILGGIERHKKASVTIAVAVVLVAIAGWWASEHFVKGGVPLPFQERDWVLITSFENRTGESLFDETLEHALERELSNSQFVNVAPPERIEDALRLMMKPPDTKVDLAIGREVCLRDGGIRALLTGRMEKLGSMYVLSVSLVDPRSERAVSGDSEEAMTPDQVGPAVRRLSNWVRQTLGEKLASIRQSNEELEKVTTPSLRALLLYTQGDAISRQSNWKVAEQLFRQALVEDTEFASAHLMVAWSLRNQKRPEDEWKWSLNRALELSERVSERERYFIQGSYYTISRQDDKAIPVYDALLQRYPDHVWGRNNLAVYYTSRVYRFQDALPHMMYVADLRPNEFNRQLAAAGVAATCHRTDEALRYARRANELINPEVTSRNPGGVAWIRYFLINEPFERGELETTLTELDRIAQTIEARNLIERDVYFLRAADSYMRFGKLQTAEDVASKCQGPYTRCSKGNACWVLALIAITKDDKEELKKSLLGLPRPPPGEGKLGRMDALPLWIRAGLFSIAQKHISDPALKEEGFVKGYQGMMLSAQGQGAQAIPLLQQGIKSAQSSCIWECFYSATESLAAIYEQQGDLPASLRALEEGCREDEAANMAGIVARIFWLRIKLQLAQLYRKLNRLEDAQRVEAELLGLLRYADADHPILVQLRQTPR